MILEDQYLNFKNVVFRGYRYFPKDINLVWEDFISLLKNHDIEEYNLLFFSIDSPIDQEIINITCFAAIDEKYIGMKSEELNFQSYFGVNNLLFSRITGDFNERSRLAYQELIRYVKNKELNIKTPFFNIIRQHGNDEYIDVYLGVEQINNEF